MKRIKHFQEKLDEKTQASVLHFFKDFIKACVYEVLNEYFAGKSIAGNKENLNINEWLSAEEAKKLLGIKSKSKMQQMRDEGKIVFSQHGRIIKYSRNSILAFLNRNVVNIHQPDDLKAAA